MDEFEFSKLVVERYMDSFDSMMNIIVAAADEHSIEMENIAHFLTGRVVEILKAEATEVHMLKPDEEESANFDLF